MQFLLDASAPEVGFEPTPLRITLGGILASGPLHHPGPGPVWFSPGVRRFWSFWRTIGNKSVAQAEFV